ncbi:MAG: hypothetical protein ABIO43_06715 [Sphingomicrobium sp.]
MATAAANDPQDFVAPGDIISLDPNEIELGERLRPIDAAFAAAIGASMSREGQLNAVDVRRRSDGSWELAGAGGHRVTGARLANIPIDAKVVVFGADIARRREAAENLFRRANDPIERAKAVVELVRLHSERADLGEADHRNKSLPKRLKDEAKGTLDIMSNVYGWSKEIAEEIGFSDRTIRRDLFLYRGLTASVVKMLQGHRVLKNAAQLRTLAKLQPAEQARAAGKLLAGAAKSVNEAVLQMRGSNSVAQTAEDKRLSAFLGTFKRMALTEQRGALKHLAGMLPAPFSLVEGGPVATPSTPTGGH